MTKKHHPKDRRERLELDELHKLDRKPAKVTKEILIEKEIEDGLRKHLEEVVEESRFHV